MTFDDFLKLVPLALSLGGGIYAERIRRVVHEEILAERDRIAQIYAKREDMIRLETLTQQVRDDIIEIKQMLRDSLGK